MLLGMAAALLISPVQKSTIELYRGAPVPGSTFSYYGVEDTTLDGANENTPLGGQGLLTGGLGRTILIRFADLRRVVGTNRRITKASLRLTVSGGALPSLLSASEVLVPWNEGPAQVVTFGKPGFNPLAQSAWAATQAHRRNGLNPISWQSLSTSTSGEFKSIPGASLKQAEPGRFVLEGIEPAIQRTLNDPFERGGLALKFNEPVDFGSSEAPSGKPTLILEVEDEAVGTGPDLSVQLIERSVDVGAYSEPGTPQSANQDGIDISVFPKGKKPSWPGNNSPITYSAVVKNVGNVPVNRFSVRWSVKERWGSTSEVATVLAPGESAKVSFETPFQGNPADRRTDPIAIEVLPIDGETNLANNGLEVHQGAFAVNVTMPIETFTETAKASGFASLDDYVQAHFSFLNRVAFPHSRYSFAPSGALDRLMLSGIQNSSPAPVVKSLGRAHVELKHAESREFPNRAVLRAILEARGLVHLSTGSNTPPVDGSNRKNRDRFAGIMGGGDTRFDGAVPTSLNLPLEPIANPMFDLIPTPANGLLSKTDVAIINTSLAGELSHPAETLYSLPRPVLLKALTFDNRPMASAKLSFYGLGSDGFVKEPFATSTTDANGTVLAPNRNVSSVNPALQPNIFGRIDLQNRNGAVLVKSEFQGQTEWAWIKLWQLVDARQRETGGFAFHELRFNLSNAPIESTNLAKGRLVTDSLNSLPAQLAAMTDDKPETSSTLSGGDGTWIEFDLGRDRAIGEVRLLVDGQSMWNEFDIIGYSTGQTLNDAIFWARERDFGWSATNRGSGPGDSGLVSVSYRAAAQQLRYLRIVNRGANKAAKISEVMALPIGPRP